MRKIRLYLKTMFETIWSLLKIVRYKSFFVRYSIPKVNDDKIFILGNGPSLKDNLENDIELLKKNDTFCVNSFCLSEYFDVIKPKYYIFLDPAYFSKENTAKRFIELQNNIFKELSNSVNWNMTLFIPNKTDMKKEWEHLCENNSNIDIVYFNNNSAHGFNSICHYLLKKNLAMPEPQNVLVGAIYLSINIGYKEIYLLGADHSWTEDLRVNDKNQLYITDKHFNASEEKLFYKGVNSENIWRMHEILKVWSNTFQAYNELETYSKRIKSNVINLSKGSYIDSFQKKDIKCLKQ